LIPSPAGSEHDTPPVRRIGVIGSLVWDRIRHPSRPDSALEQWGGIAYSLAAISASCPEGWSVVPLLKVGDDLADDARDFLLSLPHLSLDAGFRRVPEPTNRVELIYTDADRRGERLTGGVPAWEWAEIEPFLPELDALYLNFISGFEMGLETAQRVRAAFPGPIYADLHSLFLGCPGAGIRQRRALPDWEQWVACFDVVQLNEDEVAMLGGMRPREELAARILEIGASILVETRGEDGVRIEARPGPLSGEPGLLSARIPLDGPPRSGDPTGCGDVWGGTFFAHLLAGEAIESAAEMANRCASAKIGVAGTRALQGRLASVPRSSS
jgi:sugar/nucleoside kinase (ribokinase family)